MKLSEAMAYVTEMKTKLENGEASPEHVSAAASILRADVAHRALALKILRSSYKRPTQALVDSAEG